MMRTTLMLIGAAMLFALAPAAAQSPAGPSVACSPVIARAGSTFTISLPANRTTGYSWALEDPLNSAVVAYRSKHYVASTSATMGAPGLEMWTFAAVAHGKAIVSLKYARPWEKIAPPAKEALYVIVVR